MTSASELEDGEESHKIYGIQFTLITAQLWVSYSSFPYRVTWGSIENGEESPTSPPVNEASGVGVANPNFLRKKASNLSKII